MSAPASWAKWLETKEKSAAGGARAAFLGQQFPSWGEGSFLWHCENLGTLLLLLLPRPPLQLVGSAWGLEGGQTKEKEKGGLFQPSLSFPALRSLAGRFFLRFWSHQCSLLLGQFEFSPVDTEEEKRPGSERWFNGPSKSCPFPNPSIIIYLPGSHAPAPGPVSMIHNLILWERHTECPSSILPRTRTPPSFYNWIFILYKMCFDVMKRHRLQFYDVVS